MTDVKINCGVCIWHFVNIMEGVEIGDNSMIGSYVQLDPHTKIGKRVRIQPFSAITGVVGDDVFICPHVTFVDAKYPPGKRLGMPQLPEIGDGTIIGAGAIIMPVRIGKKCVVSAGLIVTHSVADELWVEGSPARVVGNRDGYMLAREAWNA